MDPGPGDAAGGGPPAPRPRRRRSLRRLFSRFLLALGSRSRPGDSPPRPQPGYCDGDGEGGFACAPGPAPAAPGSPGEERPPGPQPQLQLPAGDGARPPGAQGLKNHGNTCFMNAVVQCLSNTDLLAEFLALGRYRAAPGRAEVTEQLAALVRALWTREYTPQLSAEFKNAVSKYGSQFQGNSQHDALEFLLWLLDRVHEDLEGSSRGPVLEKIFLDLSPLPETEQHLRSFPVCVPTYPLAPDEVILVELYPSGFQRSFFDEEDLNTIAEGDNVYAFQVPPSPSQGTLSGITAHPLALSVSPRLAAREGQRFSLSLHSESKVLILFCNLVGSGQQASRFGPPFLIREDRAVSWAQLQQSILSKVRHLMKSEAPVQNLGSLFSIRVVGLSVACSYLSPKDSRPLCHWAVDRALHLRRPGGPPHVKLAVEWDSSVKERLFGNLQEERAQDADSVWQQQQAHQQHSCTLDECFQFYTKEEQLAQDDAWKCPHCQVLQQGMVKLSLWTLPDILIIHLKRFCQVGERRNKLSTLVKFPLSGLNMAPHVAQRSTSPEAGLGPWPSWKPPGCLPTSCPLDFLYDLYAVCNHHGNLQGGHYTAYCRNSLDGQWYSYDDSTVEPLREDEVNTRGAYILFYQKRNSIPPWSASSSMRGSTSSSLSDHWLLRLGSYAGSTRGSLLSWSSAPCPSLPQVPDSPIFTNSLCNQEKGGLEPRRLVRGVKGRSISMKAPTASRAKQGPFKTMPLRWSFGSKEKPPGASVELVEYLESRRRPRSTSQSIVSLLTGTAGEDEKSASPRSNLALPANSEDGGRAIERGPAGVPCPSVQPNHCLAPGNSDGPNTARKLKENAGQDIKLPRKFDLPLTVMPSVEHEKPARPEGQKAMNWKESFQMGSKSSPPSPYVGFSGNSKDSRRGTSELDRPLQGTLTLLRSVFRKKENRRNERAEVSPQVPPVSLVSGRLSPAMDGQVPGSPPALRIPEGLARGLGSRLERDVWSAPSSLRLPRKASRAPRGSALGMSQRTVPGEQASYGTFQRVKYHTLSLGRKKTLPESSF
ncbi:PREDICTED: ubiquitin carboxyl-terminal hydrolase 43 isoform X5 [Cercocebus atys]|uniref:ubiquitin carboxyl-terminal hydrolase 43 isoform X5 n=1 Tax=Cercocebus atys TaxID=9531 RepID=UPI0005F3A1C2|nr:PREDICTED: ubiquitin carboxyl-terminal hydrolase 43 isoform X5 [Cercocebus atys]